MPAMTEKQKSVKIIPADKDCIVASENRKKRVCAYCRVSTVLEEQQSSYEFQVEYYTKLINHHTGWEFSGIYSDEGFSGTSIKSRAGFLKMINDAKEGRIDFIITKSISRFARNTLDCINHVRLLRELPSPVGIYFERENIDTLDPSSELILTLLSSMAQEESRSISENIRWANQKRAKQGIPHSNKPRLISYEADKNGDWTINEAQAETVRRIYKEFMEGKSKAKIAQNLTEDQVKTRTGNTRWQTADVDRILKNEKYCGDFLMQKTPTRDLLTHKRSRNKVKNPQYLIVDHHQGIISRELWNTVQSEMARRYNRKAE